MSFGFPRSTLPDRLMIWQRAVSKDRRNLTFSDRGKVRRQIHELRSGRYQLRRLNEDMQDEALARKLPPPEEIPYSAIVKVYFDAPLYAEHPQLFITSSRTPVPSVMAQQAYQMLTDALKKHRFMIDIDEFDMFWDAEASTNKVQRAFAEFCVRPF